MVGTRTARPSSRPFNSGSTQPIATAAPVLVGIIEWVADRAAVDIGMVDVTELLIIGVGVNRGHIAS